MKMASRNIANMHLFLEMKTKFPYLPEDTLRNYVYLYAQDQAKCISLLQRENENHFHPSQKFSDYRLTENKVNLKINDNMKGNSEITPDLKNLYTPFQTNTTDNSNIKISNFHHQGDSYSTSEGRSNNHTNVIYVSSKSKNLNVPPRPEVHSAPVKDSEKPFSKMFSAPDSSHSVINQIPRDQNHHNRMMFSTTKEHIIEPAEILNEVKSSQVLPNSNTMDPSKRHAVKLSITPVLPFQQQQMNVYSNAVCATASHSSRPGRHTTSLNFQLQPKSSNQYPLEISTVPTGKGRPCNYRDFGSHVQISVGAQGTTFTALRLQRPPNLQNQSVDDSSNQLYSDETYHDYSQSPSQALNSKTGMFPTRDNPSSSKGLYVRPNDRHGYLDSGNLENVSDFNKQRPNLSCNRDLHSQLSQSKEFSRQTSFGHGFQFTPDYIQGVKKHQCAQFIVVQGELNKEKTLCSNLKSQVNRIEQELVKRRDDSSASYVEASKKLKEENRQLRLECNSLLMEYDMISKGQIPVGVTDEDFYANIFTGPDDGLALYSLSGKVHSSQESQIPQNQAIEDDYDETNSWKCKKCTFVNHPALEKCEICEISKNSGSFFDS